MISVIQEKLIKTDKNECVDETFELADDSSDAVSSHNGDSEISENVSDDHLFKILYILDDGDIHGLRCMMDKLTRVV